MCDPVTLSCRLSPPLASANKLPRKQVLTTGGQGVYRFQFKMDCRAVAKRSEAAKDFGGLQIIQGSWAKRVALLVCVSTYSERKVRCLNYSHCLSSTCPTIFAWPLELRKLRTGERQQLLIRTQITFYTRPNTIPDNKEIVPLSTSWVL